MEKYRIEHSSYIKSEFMQIMHSHYSFSALHIQLTSKLSAHIICGEIDQCYQTLQRCLVPGFHFNRYFLSNLAA